MGLFKGRSGGGAKWVIVPPVVSSVSAPAMKHYVRLSVCTKKFISSHLDFFSMKKTFKTKYAIDNTRIIDTQVSTNMPWIKKE